MSSISRTIKTVQEANESIKWALDNISKGLAGGSVVITLGREEEVRSTDQNSLGWALWTDISKQVGWYGKKLPPEAWKELLSHEWKAQDHVPAISGGFCAIGARTSKMKKREFSDLMEITFAFGSSHDVQWSDKSSKEYDKFSSRND